MPFRNLPTETPIPLRELIHCNPGEIASMSLIPLAESGICETCMLMSFDEGESVSEETYPCDTMYYLIEGSATITLPTCCARMHSGDVFMVSAGTQHAIVARESISLLQIGMR